MPFNRDLEDSRHQHTFGKKYGAEGSGKLTDHNLTNTALFTQTQAFYDGDGDASQEQELTLVDLAGLHTTHLSEQASNGQNENAQQPSLKQNDYNKQTVMQKTGANVIKSETLGNRSSQYPGKSAKQTRKDSDTGNI